MESTICFKTQKGFSYIYDMESSSLINIHPIVEIIRELVATSKSPQEIKYLLSEEYGLSQDDIAYYINKYGFLEDAGLFSTFEPDKFVSGRISGDIVKQQIANSDSILFQVTSDCNLKCKYCCYGDMYMDSNLETTISKSSVQKLFKYWFNSRETGEYLSYNRPITIGFYGGEPLVNFALVKEIVDLSFEYKQKYGIEFRYSMTTNGLLLDKYQDYLVRNDFHILISLDGNEGNDQLRVDRNNKPSFKRVYTNVKRLKELFPEFFKSNVEFNSVLNKHSSVEEVHRFINAEFGKVPLIEAISVNELNDKSQQEYSDLYQPYNEPMSLFSERKERSPMYKELGFFFYYQLNNSYKHYCELLYQKSRYKKRIPTGTCLPFFKKIFISSDNRIFACEKIGLDNVLGFIKEDGVHLDYESIADLYNQRFEKIESQCKSCYGVSDCGQCLFQMKKNKDIPICSVKMNKLDFKKYLSILFSTLEDNKDLFNEVNKMIFA